jgi:competence protein ComEA
MKLINLILFVSTAVFSTLAFAAPVDINTASAQQLAAAVKGVGPAKAQAIVRYRKAHGRFSSVRELDNVKGIGPKTIQENRGNLAVGHSASTGQGSKGR